jgi:trimeric autotransporter adhesin
VRVLRLASALVPATVLGLLLAGPGALGMLTATPVAPAATYSTGQLNAPSPLSCRWSAANDVRLTWTNTSPTFALGYDVLRSNTSGSGYSVLTSTASASTVIADDTNPSPPTARFYVVRATHAPSTWTSANSNEVTTTGCAAVVLLYAGTGTAGSLGDGGVATAAQLNNPHGVAVDTSGNVYVADTSGNRVRRIDATTHVITTVAGGGFSSSCSFSGSATSVALSGPSGIALDGSGNLYIADTGNGCIRKVSGTTVSRLAGGGFSSSCGFSGSASSVLLSSPSDVAVDSAGTVYIADAGGSCVRQVSAGTVSRLAGGGFSSSCGFSGSASSVSLSGPGGVTVDSAGNVYIADTGRNCVRKVSAGTVSRVAGGGSSSACSFAGAATSLALNAPGDVSVDGNGNVYISDTGANCVRQVSGSNVATILGTGTASYSGDGGFDAAATVNGPDGVAVNASGDVFVADAGNNRVRRVITP